MPHTLLRSETPRDSPLTVLSCRTLKYASFDAAFTLFALNPRVRAKNDLFWGFLTVWRLIHPKISSFSSSFTLVGGRRQALLTTVGSARVTVNPDPAWIRPG